jgi:hypothetical protein
MTCWGWMVDDHCWGSCEDPIDGGFRPGSQALAYHILKGATISWCVPKGVTLYFGKRTQHKGFAPRDKPNDKRSARRARDIVHGVHSGCSISSNIHTHSQVSREQWTFHREERSMLRDGFSLLTLMAMRIFWIFAMVFLPFLHFPSMMGHSLHLCTQP